MLNDVCIYVCVCVCVYIYIYKLLCWKGLQVFKFKVITPAYLTAYSVEKEIEYFSMIKNAALFSTQN